LIRMTNNVVMSYLHSFDDYFPCRKEMNCKLEHVKNWLNLFTTMHKK
jgi:hypothetical protein